MIFCIYNFLASDASARSKVELAMKNIAAVTCIRFRPKVASDRDVFVTISNAESGCWAHLGVWGGKVNLEAPGCVSVRLLLHLK